jgi:hypothetical protein
VKRFFCLFLVIFALAYGMHPAQAALDQKGADHVKKIFTDYLAQKKASARFSGQELKTEGSILVEPGQYYYAVTMPHLSMVEADGSYTDIGILAINAMPGDKPKEWKVTIAVPTPIIRYDAQKKIQARVDIGAQTLAGVWNEDAASFVKLDARYEKIVVKQITDAITVNIPKASILYNLSPATDGKTWSGPAQYTMENLEISREGDPSVSKIGRIAADVFVHDYSPAAMLDYQGKMQAVAEASKDGPVSREHVQGLYNLIFDFAGTIWDGFDTSFTVSDVDLVRPATPANPAGRIKLAKAGFGFNAMGFRKNNVSMAVKMNYEGLDITPAPAGFDEATPTRMNINLTTGKIPFKELVDLGRSTLAENQSPEQARLAGMRAFALVPQLLTTAGTTITIDPSSFGNNTYNVLMNGSIIANLQAIMGAQGKGRIEIAGLDKMIDLTGAKLKDKSLDEPSRKAIRDSMATLTILQTIGQKGKNAKGADVRTYDIELTEAGKLTLNGTDLSALQALISAAKGKDKPPAP